MTLDEGVVKVVGSGDEIATYGFRLEDIRLSGGTVEAVIDIIREPEYEGAGSVGETSLYYGPVGEIFVNGSSVGFTEELGTRGSFYDENIVTVPDASGGDDLRFDFPKNDFIEDGSRELVQDLSLSGSVPEPFTAEKVTAECQLSTQEVGRGNSMTFFATVSNQNNDPASVDVTWTVGEETYTATGETVPANATVEITTMNTVDIPGGDYSPEVSLSVQEA